MPEVSDCKRITQAHNICVYVTRLQYISQPSLLGGATVADKVGFGFTWVHLGL